MGTPSFTPPPLHQPPVMRSPQVRQWQQRLRERGWHIEPDGAYGPVSARLCANFQQEHALYVTGSVDAETWYATWEAMSTQPQPGPGQILQNGSQGEYVRQWQQQLHNRGWPITADGIFGPRTEQICRQFQAEWRLPIDGKVNIHTWDAAWLERIPAHAGT